MNQNDIATAMAQVDVPLTATEICELLGIKTTPTAINNVRGKAQRLVKYDILVVVEGGPLKMWIYNREGDDHGA